MRAVMPFQLGWPSQGRYARVGCGHRRERGPTPLAGFTLRRRVPAAGARKASRKVAGHGVSFLLVLFRQFVDDDLGCASYLIGDSATGEAFVVDPAYAIEQYLEDGVRIVRVLETHTHADHVSGHGRFALEHGVPVSVHPIAEPDYE